MVTLASGISCVALNDMDQISVDGITKLGFRDQTYDVADSAPSWGSSNQGKVNFYQAEKGGAYRPKLVVTHAVPATGKGFFGMM